MHVAVVGGGVVGASLAYQLARRDATTTVLEQDDCCSATTSRASGGFRHQFATPENIRMSAVSHQFYTDFENHTGVDPGFRENGYLFLLRDRETDAVFRRARTRQHAVGVETELLTADEVADRYPSLDTGGVVAATFHGKDGLFDPDRICHGFVTAAERAGADIRRDTGVTDILTADGAVTGVRTGGETVDCDAVVNAAGPWAPAVADMVDTPLPVTPKRRQVAVISPDIDVDPAWPLISDFDRDVYCRPTTDGTLLVGGRVPDDDPAQDPDAYDGAVDDYWVTDAVSTLQRVLPFDDYTVESGRAGLYSITPDRKPVIGQAGPDGFHIAAGFSGHGVMHAPATGICIAEQLLDGEATTVDTAPYRYDRFETFEL